jgi:hypothetical protein
MTMGIAEDKFSKKVHLFFKASSPVDTWYEGLEATVRTGSWDTFMEKFLEEFPSLEVKKPTESERRRELLLMELKVEELGTRDEATKEWAHQRFARKLLDLAKAAGIAKGDADIIAVYDKLPRIIREKAKEDAKTWSEFTKSIADVEVKCIRDRKEDEERFRRVEARLTVPETPSKALARSLANANIGVAGQQQRTQSQRPQQDNDVFNTNIGGRSNYANPFPRRLPNLSETQKTTLQNNIDAYQQKPNTPEGIAAYRRDLTAFFTRWGRNPTFTEQMIYPYAPGTLKPGSGECFKCGSSWHGRNVVCPPENGTIAVNEGHYRAFVQRELGYTKTAQVNVVGEEDDDWMFAGFKSGNGSGSTA